MNTELEPIILEPDAARVMEGLRDTGYDFNMAIADLLDNSIAADASVIKVTINRNPINGEITLFIADNGCGMDMDGLKNAMKYGAARRTDPSSLGKFGLGLKTASTAFCRSLSLLSKSSKDDTYRKVEWDLDLICQINRWQLQTPEIQDDEIDLLEDVADGNSGTLVIWRKVDRMIKQYKSPEYAKQVFNNKIESLRHHVGMVYERFLNGEAYNDKSKKLVIYINNLPVSPYDPFCKNEEKLQIPVTKTVNVTTPEGEIGSFKITAYVLPRVDEFSSPEAKKMARINNDNQGFYIYRENRLIKYGATLGMFTKDPHCSLLRIDFSFDHKLDEAFNVDIKKSRVSLNEEIYEFIEKTFLPSPRKLAQDKYRKGATIEVGKKTSNIHDNSNTNISEKAPGVEGAKVTVTDVDKNIVTVQNTQGTFTGQFTIINVDETKPLRVVPCDTIDSGMLWEPTIVNNAQAVSINRSHDFYKKVYAPNADNINLISALDSLLWALSEAEWTTYNDDVKEQYEEMRVQVSRILKKLVKDLPDPEIEI